MIPLVVYQVAPTTALGRALADARAIVERWSDAERRNGDAVVASRMTGWSVAALAEEIAAALLSERGFDVEALIAALDCAPSGVTEADVIATWERGART